jgi:hypothetical protein
MKGGDSLYIVLSGAIAEEFTIEDAIKMHSKGFAVTLKNSKIVLEKEKSA